MDPPAAVSANPFLLSSLLNPATLQQTPPTNYGDFVLAVLSRMNKSTNTASSNPPSSSSTSSTSSTSTPTSTGTTPSRATLDQPILRQTLGLASSYLVTDSSMHPNPSAGITSWSIGFNRLVDLVVVLHARSELELETFNAASRACSECWSVAGQWRGIDSSRDVVRAVALKLKKLLDENGRTYQGRPVYTP